MFAFAVTALLAVVIGGAFSWTASTTGAYTANAGTLSVAIANDAYTGNALYPTGIYTDVVSGQIQNNTPANPGIPVQLTGGSVGGFTPSNGGCSSGHFAGDVIVTDSSFVGPGGGVGGSWMARILMGTGAPDVCQGNTVGYNVTLNVAT